MSESEGTNTFGEILGQPVAWEATLREAEARRQVLKSLLETDSGREVLFIGCGSTYYLSLAAARLFQGLVGTRAKALPSSEVFLFPQHSLYVSDDTLLIPVSRSGETSETLRAVDSFKESGGHAILAITCEENSALMRICPNGLVARGAKELSVAQTRSFTSMFLLAQFCAGIAASDDEYRRKLRRLPSLAARIIDEGIGLAKELGESREFESFVFLGSGLYYGLACEAMLKMKEMSLSISEAFHFMEFRHGPVSTIDEQTLVVGLLSDSARAYEVSVLEEVRRYGARTLVLTEEKQSEEAHCAEYLVALRSGLPEWVRAPLVMPVLQLLAYYRAMREGLNPDSPRNLRGVVIL